MGVFYREFTKFLNFTGKTTLSVLHTHYFLLGMFFFLALLLLEKAYNFSSQKSVGKILLFYNIGLNITGLGLFFRGILQVYSTPISNGLNASLSGISGIGHILLSISMILLLLRIRKCV